ncbi:hypothetical protein [Streptomyces sp. NPDC058385]
MASIAATGMLVTGTLFGGAGRAQADSTQPTPPTAVTEAGLTAASSRASR